MFHTVQGYIHLGVQLGSGTAQVLATVLQAFKNDVLKSLMVPSIYFIINYLKSDIGTALLLGTDGFSVHKQQLLKILPQACILLRPHLSFSILIPLICVVHSLKILPMIIFIEISSPWNSICLGLDQSIP